METKPLFSLLVPVYNAGNTIGRCVSSLLEQGKKPYEIVLLDDGSTDESLEKCLCLQKKHPELIRVLHQENAGAVLSRRRLLSEAEGEWLWLIDADDEIIKGSLDFLAESIENTRCDMILFDHFEQQPEGSWSQVSQLPHEFAGRTFTGKEKMILYRQAVMGNLNPLWNKVFRRSVVDFAMDYRHFADLKKGNDRLQMLPLLTNAGTVYYSSVALYRYSYNMAGLTASFGKHTVEASERGIGIVKMYAHKWNGVQYFRNELALLRNRHIYQLLTQYILENGKRITYPDFRTFFRMICANKPLMEDYDLLPLTEIDSYARAVTKAVRAEDAMRAYAVIRLRHALHKQKKQLRSLLTGRKISSGN